MITINLVPDSKMNFTVEVCKIKPQSLFILKFQMLNLHKTEFV